MRTPAVLLVLPFLAACASDPKPTFERGWIGGRFADVTRSYAPDFAASGRESVVGMPASAPGDSGALVVAAYDGSPLARAGLVPGDLLLSLDGRPADGGLDVREQVEAMTPGSKARAAYWRDGQVRETDVVVGRETYESAGKITIGLALSLRVDLWPFDDGIDVLGVIRVQKDHARQELGSPVALYRRQVDADAKAPPQEMFEVFVLPIGFGTGKRVLRQETLP